MHAVGLLHNLLDSACKSIDKRLRRVLFEAAESLTRGKKATITGIGRSLARPAKIKHRIKCIDRLLGNNNLHQKREMLYQGISKLILKGNKRPIIIVDWSGLTPCGEYNFLRASIAVEGRALTLYEEVHPLCSYMKERIHNEFLKKLALMIPSQCKPIIITDAGFRNPWFKAILKKGWDFIGRIRNNTLYRKQEKTRWDPIKSLYEHATTIPKYIGRVLLARKKPLSCYFFIFKQKKKNRVKRNLAGKKIQCSVSKKHERRENEPWLLATSLPPSKVDEATIIKIYKKRMQIEESFRDLKNTCNGLGLRHCRSFSVERLNTILLIAALAILVLWILGIAARKRNLHHSFQSNTEKRRTVLSDFSIGCQVVSEGIKIGKNDLIKAFFSIYLLTKGGIKF